MNKPATAPAEPANQFEPIPYRIRLGVTGHRDLPNPAEMEALVRQAIDAEVNKLFSDASQEALEHVRQSGVTPVAYSVLSPLAEGADRVVARAVLRYSGARLDVVLPLTVDDYLEDFATLESAAEFTQLLDQCPRPVVLRRTRIRDEVRDPEDQQARRGTAYERAGRYVVDHCDLLIALWDGAPSRGTGGTAEIVQYAKEQQRPVLRVWNGTWEVLHPGNGLSASGIERIDHFNRYRPTRRQNAVYTSKDDWKEPDGLPQPSQDLISSNLRPYYRQASIIASVNQAMFHRAGWFIYLFSALAIVSVALATIVHSLAVPGYLAELALLITAIIALRRARRSRAQEMWMECRFLAERLRSGMFLAACGVEPSPIEVLPFMGHAHTADDWMVRVFDEVWKRMPRLPECPADKLPALTDFARRFWIQGQIGYHQSKREREGLALKMLEDVARVVLPATLGAAGLHLVPKLHLPCLPSEWGPGLEGFLSFIAIAFPAVAASVAGMLAHREYKRLEKGSENILPHLERLNRQMKSVDDRAQFEAVLHRMDELMLRETQGWLMLMRYVEIQLH